MSPLNAAICTTTYLDVQKCYGLGKKTLFKKQLFDLDVKGQGPMKVTQTSRKLLINLTTSSIPTLSGIRTYNVSGDRHWMHFHTITTTTASKSQ
jgi:hypothetical protein